MEACMILVVLLSLCSHSFCQECNRELQENIDFPGTDITFLYSPDVAHCQQLCTQHPACLFFTFIRADWTRDDRHFYCYLKSTPSGQPNVRTPLPGVTSGFSLKPCNPDPHPCLSHLYQNVDFYGADYSTFFTSGYEECQRACNQDPSCQFFTFVNGDFARREIRYKCHLKFSWTIPRTPIVEGTTGVISGFSHKVQMTQKFDRACQSTLLLSTNIPGHDIETLPAASPELCQVLCSAHPRCTYFSYNSKAFSCSLKNNPNQLVTQSNNGYVSGMPARFCQLDTNWTKVAFEGLDFRASDLHYEVMDDAESCQKKCTADPRCQFYTYCTENFAHTAYRRRCYLKRVITMPAPPKVAKLTNVVSGFSLNNCANNGTDV